MFKLIIYLVLIIKLVACAVNPEHTPTDKYDCDVLSPTSEAYKKNCTRDGGLSDPDTLDSAAQ